MRNGGCFQHFQHERSSIYWSPTTDVHTIRGHIRDRWEATGWENGTLGYPTSDETCGLRDGGCSQDFQKENAHILWSGPTGAHFIRGAVNTRYTELGRQNGDLGYPITDEVCGLKDGGCYQHFQLQRGSIYYVSYYGAHEIRGAIRDRWAATGWETGPLSYPSTNERCGLKNGGCSQEFGKAANTTHPRAIYYTPNTGAHDVITAGILEQWSSAGRENGRYGYPLNNPGQNQYGKLVQQFQGDWITTDKA